MSFFDKILGSKCDDEPLEAQLQDSAWLSPLHEPCDEIPNAKGPFGYSETNPIPVNGIAGECVYLFQLKAKNGASVFYHRIGNRNLTNQKNQTMDIFEVVASDGSQWATLYFLMYFPRRSVKCPEGFSLKSWSSMNNDARMFSKLPCFGRFSRVNNFPLGLPEQVEKDPKLNSAMPGMGALFAGKIRGILSQNRGSWQRSDDQVHNMMGIEVDGFMTMNKDGSPLTVEKIKNPTESDPVPAEPPGLESTRMPLPPNQCPICRMVDDKGAILLPKLPKSELDPLFTHVTIHLLRRLGNIDGQMFEKLLELVDRTSEAYEKTVLKYTDYARAEGVDRGLNGLELDNFIRDYIDEENVALIFENWHRNGDAPKASTFSKDIYITRGQETLGPYPYSQLLQWLGTEKVTKDDLVAYDGALQWVKLEQLIVDVNQTKGAFGGKQSWDKPISEKTGLEVAQDILEGRFATTK